jgi:hypothetical protein
MMPMTERLLTLIGDRRNVAGLVGAAAGLGLTFGGVIEAGWWAITGGLYAAGFLGTQILAPPPRENGPLWQAAPVADLPADLRRLARDVGPQLPEAARNHLANILASVSGIEPKLREVAPNNPSVTAVRQIMADYIPTTLKAYRELPPRVRSATRLNDGRTADEQITAQLALLETQMDRVVDTLSRGDLDALEAQGRFLDEKFHAPNLFTD